MASSRFKKQRQQKVFKTIGIALIALAVGCYMLFVVSRSYRPILGNTFHIIAGCVFIAVSGLVLLITLKNYFFPKKKKKRGNVVFLEDELRKQSRKNDPATEK